MRLIDADALKEKAFFHEIDNVSYVEEEDIDNTPTVDAVERKKGKWRLATKPTDSFAGYRCSECNELVYGKTNYCPRCGAEMRGEANA